MQPAFYCGLDCTWFMLPYFLDGPCAIHLTNVGKMLVASNTNHFINFLCMFVDYINKYFWLLPKKKVYLIVNLYQNSIQRGEQNTSFNGKFSWCQRQIWLVNLVNLDIRKLIQAHNIQIGQTATEKCLEVLCFNQFHM